MNILMINPNTSSFISKKMNDEAQNYIEKNGFENLKIDVVNAPYGVDGIETYIHEHNAVNAMMDYLDECQILYDGLIIGCAGDPGLEVLREKLDIPVVSLMNSSMIMSNLYSDTFSIISTGDESDIYIFKKLARVYGFENKLVSVNYLNIGVGAIDGITEEIISEKIKNLKRSEGIGVVILACAAFAGLSKKFSDETNVHVMDGISQSIALIKSMVEIKRILI